MNRKLALIPLVVLLSFGWSCSKCASGGASRPTQLVPGDTAAVVLLPDLTVLMGHLEGLLKKFSVGPVATFLTQAQLTLNRNLGFDPLKPEEWRKLGIDPARGLALAVDAGGVAVVAIGLADVKVFETEVQKRLRDLAAADQVSSASVQGVAVTTVAAKDLATPSGERLIPRLHYTVAGRFALLTAGGNDPKVLVRAASLKDAETIEAAPWFSGLLAKSSKDADLLVVLNGPKAAERLPLVPQSLIGHLKDGLSLSISLSPTGIGLRLFLGIDAETGAKLSGLQEGVADAHLENRLPEDTVLALKGRVNAGRLLDLVLSLDPATRTRYEAEMNQAKQALGMDIQAGTLGNLAGSGVLGISLGRVENLRQAFSSGLEEDAATAIRLLLWIQLKDGPAFAQVLQKALALGPFQRLSPTQSTAGSLQVVQLRTPKNVELRLLSAGDLLGLCLGSDCEQAASQLAAGGKPSLADRLSPEAKRLFDSPSILTGILRFETIAQAVAGLDAGALGDGGLMVKMVLDLVATALRNIRELTGAIQFLPEGVALEGRLHIQ